LAGGGFVRFRHDINALRALAVTAVVLFHYKVNFISGGFVGVDVFFVISGYLMTAIIMGRLEKGRFSLWDFYYDRAVRIVPGLLGVCAVLLAAGYFVLEPVTYQYLGSTGIAALLFFSNFRFWEATGYFDPDVYTKWFLHTWSLSVEWQFYLAYPLVLMGLYRTEKTRRYILPALWAFAGLSFALCLWASKFHPAAAFYLLPQRAWELLAGGIIALQFQKKQWKRPWLLISAGFLLIAASIRYYDSFFAWPSYWALAPAAGTCLVIAANRPDARLFQNAAIQTIGKWSYSIYLWHWPIAVGAVYFDFDKTRPLKIAAEILVLATILATGGWLSTAAARLWKERLGQARLANAASGALTVAASVAFAIIVASHQGLPDRWPDGQKDLAAKYAKAVADWEFPAQCAGPDEAGNLRPCQLGDESGHDTLFIGDSFAEQIYSRFAEHAKSSPQPSFTFLTTPGCPPVDGVEILHDRFRCNGFADKALRFAETHPFRRLLLVSFWDYFKPSNTDICLMDDDGRCIVETDPQSYYRLVDKVFSRLGHRLSALRKSGTEVVIVSPIPWGDWNVPLELAKRKFLGLDAAEVETIDRARFESGMAIKARLISLAASVGARYFDPADYLCDARRCPATDQDGVPLYRDQHHLRAGAVKTSRFQFLDDAAGISTRLSAASSPGLSTP